MCLPYVDDTAPLIAPAGCDVPVSRARSVFGNSSSNPTTPELTDRWIEG